MANDMVERVAAAISLTRDGFADTPPMPVTDYDRDLARAALEAMREPSTVVRLVGGYVQQYGNDDGDTYAYVIWQAMIDAALSQEDRE